MKIVLLGAPGAGKGTQAKLFSARFGVAHISTGDIFRLNIKNGTELGMKAKVFMDQGLLVPDSLVLDLIIDRLKAPDCSKGYVLDGFPRTIPQAEALDEALKKQGDAIEYAINVDASDDDIVRRMSGRRVCPGCGATYHVVNIPPKQEGICDNCGDNLILRDDDKPETVRKRLKVYHEQTSPLIDYYKKRTVMITVDGMKDPDEVFNEIVRIVSDK
jgi:adenylate kinase